MLDWFSDRSGSEALAIQCKTASVIRREHTGVGQITQIECAPSAPAANFPTNCVPNAPLVDSPLLPYGATSDLWLAHGKLYQLEIVALGGTELPRDQFPFQLVDVL
jgi:hypothetical protein